MPFYHILIGYDDPKRSSRLVLYELDLSKNDVEVFVEQYKKGRVLFKGKWLDVLNIEEIEIQETQHPHDSWANIVPLVSVEDITISSRGTKAKDVTRQFVRSEPKKLRKSAKQSVSSKDVFVVHGHDIQSVNELKKMLVEFGLNPIVLHEQPSGSRTIVEKLEKYSDVGYAFVILTPDDIGCLNIEVSKSLQSLVGTLQNLIEAYTVIKHKGPLKRVHGELSKVASSFKPRARQNVVLEFGYFIGFLGRDRVCCLYKGDVELPSDMHGIVYLPFKNSLEEIRVEIMKELKQADYEIKL